jgi:hypothetical protein
MWAEVETAEKENRRELVLTGKPTQERIKASGLDMNIFKLDCLNYLDISEAGLTCLPEQVANLTNLTQLVLKGNSLATLPDIVSSLVKLKLLDVSKNRLSTLPDLSGMDKLATLNLSLNKFQSFPDVGIDKCKSLSKVDLSVNDLTDISLLEAAKLELLADVNLCRNELPGISGIIKENWPALKKLNLSDNKIKQVPAEIGDLLKVKELLLVNNPLQDNRLKKMTSQKTAKTLLDYIRQNGAKGTDTSEGQGQGGKKGKGKSSGKSAKDTPKVDVDEICDKLSVLGVSSDYPEVVVELSVKDVRPFIVTCFVKNIDLSGENMRKFLQLQTKLHKGVCENRKIATIATHDLSAVKGPLRYTTMKPELLKIEPLDGSKPVSATRLMKRLLKEAEEIRKDKKRSQVSGIHQYVHMLDRWEEYPCLLDATDRVLSFPPVTNSGITKISEETTEIMVEVTSGSKLADAKIVADALLREILEAGLCNNIEDSEMKELSVYQGRVIDHEGTLKVAYPSKTDLTFEKVKFAVERN